MSIFHRVASIFIRAGIWFVAVNQPIFVWFVTVQQVVTVVIVVKLQDTVVVHTVSTSILQAALLCYAINQSWDT